MAINNNVIVLGLLISSMYSGLATTAFALPAVFDVTKYGAVGDGSPATTDDGDSANSLAFIQAWRAACDSPGVTRVIIPKGTFMVGPVLFSGPCKSTVTVEIQGIVLANPDVTLYSEPEWILFENVDGVTLTGTGVVDGNGPKTWSLNDCSKSSDCAPLPTSIKFHRVNNGVIDGIKSDNAMFFHMFITNCQNVAIRNVKITAPFNSPNTDGIHIGGSTLVNITNSIIGTGDDCISIGHGSKDITVTGVTCGPGHGISIGSLGKYNNELEVSKVLVKNCTLIGTTNGARVKSWPGNKPNKASGIIFEDLIMDHVKNPIIIDQQYGKKKSTEASHVKISDVHFRNIRGTSTTNEVVTLACSPAIPCEGIEISNINLTFDGKQVLHRKVAPNLGVLAICSNAKVTFSGKHDGINC
ncbi:exopolygalacturonase clone GBGE184-like [Silene latifolia]|uniref:exopolygalacturonase clone GBGE184-like n=1 Tax=Silene latifolia TaxID=37657 RepID=UPI003D77BFE3